RRGHCRDFHALQRVVLAWSAERQHVAEVRRGGVPRRERLEPETVRDGSEHGSVIDGALLGAKHGAGRDARRDEEGRHADAEALEVEAELTDGRVRRNRRRRRRYVVEVSAVLVVGDDEQRVLPRGAGVKRVVDVVQELLTGGDVVVRMLAVAGGAEIRLEK